MRRMLAVFAAATLAVAPLAASAQETTETEEAVDSAGEPVDLPASPRYVIPSAPAVPAPPPVLTRPPAVVRPAAPPVAVPAPAPALPPAPIPALSFDLAVLQALDKVSARVMTIEAPVGQPVRFGSLEIIARACKKHRPEDQPESAAFLDISEMESGQPAVDLFRGWMFASSPALSAMEHPVYDIWVLDCRARATP